MNKNINSMGMQVSDNDENNKTFGNNEYSGRSAEHTDENVSQKIGEDEPKELKGIIESMLFVSNEPLPISFFVKKLDIEQVHIKIVLDSLVDEYDERDGGILLRKITNGYQFVTNGKFAEQIRGVMGFDKRETLSKGMLETLAIIAYKQPVILAEIDEFRGASSRTMIASLIRKNLVKPLGRKEVPGRPLTYGTTNEFLQCFGLNKITDLPKLSEIKELSI